MAVNKILYQTVEDPGYPDPIEVEGPHKCIRRDAWMGQGYYFWESHIQNAHWWGAGDGHFENGYVICRADYIIDDKICYNLIDNPDHQVMFNDAIDLMIKHGLYKEGITTVARIIEFLKNKLRIFRFEATRAIGVNSKTKDSEYSRCTPFVNRAPYSYLDTLPPIQICFYTKKAQYLSNYTIIYPEKYVASN